jgi:FkbM family methyltransferase
MISYAQNLEDVMLYRVFRDRRSGFYIDVGAADPVHHSVTKWFYDLGWSGINIEPHSRFFQALQRERPRDVNLNCGAGAAAGKAVFVEMEATPEWSSFDEAAQHAATKRGEGVTEHRLPILTLNDIIKRHGAGRKIDFLKIDVEGWERQVLSGLDLKRHRPIIIVVEATRQGTAERNESAWEELLIGADYRAVFFDGLNKFYLDDARSALGEYFAVPPNVFDDYKLHDWEVQLDQIETQLNEAQAESTARLKTINTLEKQRVTLSKRLNEAETDRAARLDTIKTLDKERATLSKRLAESETDRSARLETVKALEKESALLSKRLNEAETDRAARLDTIKTLDKERATLSKRLADSDADRAARLEAIKTLDKERATLSKRLSETEADRTARLEIIEVLEKERLTLGTRLAESEADRAARLDTIKALESERAALSTRLTEAEIDQVARWGDIRNLEAERAALLELLSQSDVERAGQAERIARLDEERGELSDRVRTAEAELDRSRADIASRDASLARVYREIEAMGKSLDDGIVTGEEAALQILRRAKRILESRIVRLSAKLMSRS